MKKFFTVVAILAVMIAGSSVKAHSTQLEFIPMTMGDYYWATVVNCNEWITLRDRPSVYGDGIAHIPLGATVKIYKGQLGERSSSPENGFYWTEYKNMKGWALKEYIRVEERAGSAS